jgi:hypothetical protein
MCKSAKWGCLLTLTMAFVGPGGVHAAPILGSNLAPYQPMLALRVTLSCEPDGTT